MDGRLCRYALARSVRELFTKHSAQTVMYLGLPILLYVSAFGAVLDSGVRLVRPVHRGSAFPVHPTSSNNGFCRVRAPSHAHDLLSDFAFRWYFGRFAGSPRQHGDFFADVIARILYGSLEAAYYTAALPMRFLADSNMVYDKTTNIVVVVLLFCTLAHAVEGRIHLPDFTKQFQKCPPDV